MSNQLQKKAEEIVSEVNIADYVDYFGEEELVNGVKSCMAEDSNVLRADTEQLVKAVQDSVNAGLLLGNGLDFAYLSPEFSGGGVQFMYGWKGIKFSSLHYGNAEHIRADVVKRNDDFDGIDRGKAGWDQIQHKEAVDFRGNSIGFYGAIELESGFVEVEYMTLAEDIAKHLINTKSAKKRLNDGAQFVNDLRDFVQGDSDKSVPQILQSHGFSQHDTWVKWFDLMARKTVLARAARRHVNFSPQVSSAIRVADKAEGSAKDKTGKPPKADKPEDDAVSKTDQLKNKVGAEDSELVKGDDEEEGPGEESAKSGDEDKPSEEPTDQKSPAEKKWRELAEEMGLKGTDISALGKSVTASHDGEPQDAGWYKHLLNKLKKMDRKPSYWNEMIEKHDLTLDPLSEDKESAEEEGREEGEDTAQCTECGSDVEDEDVVESSMKQFGRVVCEDCEAEQNKCADCGEEVPEKVREFSIEMYGEPVCQKDQKKRSQEGEPATA